MTGKELVELVHDSNLIYNRMISITSSDQFRVNNDYKISGYDVKDIERLIGKLLYILGESNYEMESVNL